jgi:hypothetical protein
MQEVIALVATLGVACVSLSLRALFLAALIYVIYKIVRRKQEQGRIRDAWFRQAFETNKKLAEINEKLAGNGAKAESAEKQEA